MPCSRIYLAIAASIAITAVIACFTTTRDFRPIRYYMPGALGAQRVAALRAGTFNAQRLTLNAQVLKHSEGPDWGVDHLNVKRYALDVKSSRAFLTRVIGLRAGDEQAWGERNGLTAAIPFSHNLGQVFPRELYKTHPEFFPLENGKRVLPHPGPNYYQPDLGRPDVAAYAAQQASRYFDAHPDAVSFSLGVDDGLLFGESPETLALVGTPKSVTLNSQRLTLNAQVPENAQSRTAEDLNVKRSALNVKSSPQEVPSLRYFRGRPDYSPMVFTFMNRAAAELTKTHPDKYLGCLAYYWCENNPPFPVDPHVIPFVTADRSQDYDPAFHREEFALQDRWAKALRAGNAAPSGRDILPTLKAEKLKSESNGSGISDNFSISASQHVSVSPMPRIGLYDYLDGFGFLVPRVPIHAFAAHIKHARAVGFTEYYGESNLNWGLDGPMPWVIAQLLQDPSLEVDALLDDYYANYFQAAAGPMRKFFERCERQWMQQQGPSYWLKYYRSESQADLFPPAVCADLRQLLDAAKAAAAKADTLKSKSLPSDTTPVRHFQLSAFSISAFGGRDSDIVAQRVRLVSDSFGVTERYVAFQTAREALARGTLNAQLLTLNAQVSEGADGTSGNSDHLNVKRYALNVERLLEEYTATRASFIHYTNEVTAKWPLAFYPIRWDDWLKDDPAAAAEAALRGTLNVQRLTLNSQVADKPGSEARSDDLNVKRYALNVERSNVGISAFRNFGISVGSELLAAPDLSGRLLPGRHIAGLQFGIDLPTPWGSTIEPTQFGVAELRTLNAQRLTLNAQGDEHEDGASSQSENLNVKRYALNVESSPASAGAPRLLHFSGQVAATTSQWVHAEPGKHYVATVNVRGVVSSGSNVMLAISFLDAKQQRIGIARTMYLPTGHWAEFVQLLQTGTAPANAAWVGIGVMLQNQVAPEDYADFTNFSLKELGEDAP